MQSRIVRGPRGVQSEDVWAAADAVLALGERPTIERVRQHLGRGSPNTVGPMLDGWYGSLAQRLRTPEAAEAGSVESASGLPGPVARAAQVLWGRALKQAEEQASDQIATAKADLAAQAEALAQARDALQQDARRLEDRSAAYALAMQAKDQQIAELGRLNESLQQQLLDGQRQLERASAECQQLRQAAEAAHRSQAAREIEQHAERARLEERAHAQERRLHAEVDRARQESKRLALQLESESRKSAKSLSDALERSRDLENQLGALQSQTAQLTKELQASHDDRLSLQLRLQEREQHMLSLLNELRDRLPPSPTEAARVNPRPRRVRVKR